MGRQITFCIVFLFALTALRAAAQTPVEVIPPSPTSADNITLRFNNTAGIIGSTGVTLVGNHFRFDFATCPILCFPTLDVPIGTLPAGTYTYEIWVGTEPAGTGSFAVAALPAVPTLSPTALAALCLVMIGAGWFLIGRQT